MCYIKTSSNDKEISPKKRRIKMALTRKFLTAMGIEDDKVDQIIDAHSDTVNGLKEQIDKYKSDAEKLPELQKELETVKKSIVDPEKDPIKVKYEALKEEFEDYKKGVEDAKTKADKEQAYRKLLKEVGINDKRIDAVVRVSDFESLELEADGKVKGAEGLMESIKAEWADFIVTKDVKGADTATPPQNTGGKTITKEEIMAIKDGATRRKHMAENPELFDL